MAAPIIKDSLYVVLNINNNWTSTGQLTVPIASKTRCRFISNASVIIKTNFTQDCFVLDAQNQPAAKQPGLAFTGDEKVWFDLKDKFIQNPTISLYSASGQTSVVQLDSIQICVQFI